MANAQHQPHAVAELTFVLLKHKISTAEVCRLDAIVRAEFSYAGRHEMAHLLNLLYLELDMNSHSNQLQSMKYSHLHP